MTTSRLEVRRDSEPRHSIGARRLEWAAARLSALLAAAALVAAAGSLFFPGLLSGEPVTDGNLRGTSLVVLLLGLPVLGVGIRLTSRGSPRGLVAWLAAVAYLTYQGVMFCFGTPINPLFLAYVAVLGLGIWTSAILIRVVTLGGRQVAAGPRMPWRAAPAVLMTLAILNALVWLARVAPMMRTGDQPEALEGSGLLTSPGWVQDLAFWIPAAVVAAVLMWRRSAQGVLLVAAMLAFYVLESISIASDQWWGARADDSHPAVAAMSVVPAALVLAVLIGLPLVWVLRSLRGDGDPEGNRHG